MAARGTQSKEILIDKIMELFPDAFLNGKELRIPMKEDGQEVQIKVALTCAKDNIPHNGNTATADTSGMESFEAATSAFPGNAMNKPTEDEKARVEDLLRKLGM